MDQPTHVISAWSVTTARTGHVGLVSQHPHRGVKACLMGQTTSSRLANMLGCPIMRFCISTLVITYGEKSRSHLARVWLTFWIGPLRTRRLTVNPMKSFHACCLWKKLRLLHGQVMPPNPPLSKCGKCTRFTALGSNAYIQVKTCLDCGHQTRIKREPVYAE